MTARIALRPPAQSPVLDPDNAFQSSRNHRVVFRHPAYPEEFGQNHLLTLFGWDILVVDCMQARPSQCARFSRVTPSAGTSRYIASARSSTSETMKFFPQANTIFMSPTLPGISLYGYERVASLVVELGQMFHPEDD